MAEKGFFARLFGHNDVESEPERQTRPEDLAEGPIKEEKGTTLQDVEHFVTELQSYYYNDICKMESDLLVQTSLSPSRIKFINKKIKQDEVALTQIDNILNLIRDNEKDFQSIGRKSMYSFYQEIEEQKLGSVQEKIFEIIINLYAINTKKELDQVISKRIESYREAWKISNDIKIPKNYNLILFDEEKGIEEYHFGNFTKKVYVKDQEKNLTSEQLKKIRNLKIEFEDEISTSKIWVYVASVQRYQLNFMRRTCIIKNDWEKLEDPNSLFFDVVDANKIEEYLKGVLQIVLTKNTYSVISIIIPTNNMQNLIGEVKYNGDKVKICRKYGFILKERNGIYENNLITTVIDRRFIPQTIKFIPFLKYKKDNF